MGKMRPKKAGVLVMANRKIVKIHCPACGRDGLSCRHTRHRDKLLVRYYKCVHCGHKGRYIQGLGNEWWHWGDQEN